VTGKRAVVIVAHPDDETLWAGGTILLNRKYRWTVVTLCRRSDPDRAPKFFRVLARLGAEGKMGDLDDGPAQIPLRLQEVEAAILTLLPGGRGFELLITHGPQGEYTRHRRHEEVSRAVHSLWQKGRLQADELWLFAYEDGNRKFYPKAVETAHRLIRLPQGIFRQKYRLMTELYGYSPHSFEANTTPTVEAFWCFTNPDALKLWLNSGGHPS